jgi:hypothetical protein
MMRKLELRQLALTFLQEIWATLGGDGAALPRVELEGSGDLPAAFAVSDLAAATIASAGLAISELVAVSNGSASVQSVQVDRRRASFWFGTSLQPQGWSMPPTWDPLAGDYATVDGWIRLHTNAPHHREAALAVVQAPADKARVAAAVSQWRADELERAIIDQGGCAAAMRPLDAWREHPQGRSVAGEPLLWWEETNRAHARSRKVAPGRPLTGIRVLDLTRVLAGPVATRFLAGFGAEVLRIDPPWWDEPAFVPEVVLGKRCARLDLRAPDGRERFFGLLRGADVLVHGYRPEALARLGLGVETRREARPGLIDVSLDAYGWTGPWCGRRGFDSLVQMSSGIADEGMRRFGKDRPTPLPVQALDHATGYLMAAAVVRGLTRRLTTDCGWAARTSLAKVAAFLSGAPGPSSGPFRPKETDDFQRELEVTSWGPALRLKPPVVVEGAPMKWDFPAAALGSSTAAWRAAP